MAEIAFASGFGSIRRFNERFQQLFDRPPGALRRSSGRPAGPEGEIRLLLRYRPPDWDAMLDFLRLRAIAGIEQVQGRRYTRSISLDGAQGTVAVEPGGDALLATVRFPRLPSLPVIIARLRRQFDLDSDPAAIAAQLSHDPVLAALTRARPGLRIPGAWDGFELAMRAVLGQQIAAIRLGGKLVAWRTLARPQDGLTHDSRRPPSPPTWRRWACRAAARARCRPWPGGAGGPDAVRGRQRPGRRSGACGKSGESGNGRRSTSLRCASRTRSRRPTSA